MILDFVKLSPTRNMTILVTSPVERPQHVSVAEQLMDSGSVHAEQVGFLEPTSIPGARLRLQMMGGEFCGNATMSVGAFLAFQDDLPDRASADYPLEVSGADGVVHCRIRREGSAFIGTVAMPLPEKIEEISFGGRKCPVVFLPGIAHAIIDAQTMTPAEAEALIPQWCAAARQEAFGIILKSGSTIKPLVYVRETNSAVWEQGCGSGTAAVGAYVAYLKKAPLSVEIAQPGGVIRADVAWEGGISGIKITGTVKIAAMGRAWIG